MPADRDPTQPCGEVDTSLTAMLCEQMPLCDPLGISAVRADRTEVVLRGTWAADRTTVGGLLHGGYVMALADAAGAVAATLHLPPGASTVTVQSSTNFLRGVRHGCVTARSVPVHVGRSVVVVQSDVTRDDGELVARVVQTQAVIDGSRRAG